MYSIVRFFAGAVAALALSGPAFAGTPEPAGRPAAPQAPAASPGAALRPTAVVMRIEGGFDAENRWLWYERDGTAHFEGTLPAGRGRFRSRVDYAKVERLVADAELCTRDAAVVHPAGMDIFTYRVGVRCGDGWRLFTTYDAFAPAGSTHVREAARGLSQLLWTSDWSRSNETALPPDLPDKLRPARP